MFAANPMSLCFVLLRGQFRHFWSGSGSRGGLGSGGVGGLLMTPTTPSVFYPLQRRNPTEIDRVVGHLLVRCILCLHQSFAVRANINRPCAQAFSTTTATNTTETAAVEVRKSKQSGIFFSGEFFSPYIRSIRRFSPVFCVLTSFAQLLGSP